MYRLRSYCIYNWRREKDSNLQPLRTRNAIFRLALVLIALPVMLSSRRVRSGFEPLGHTVAFAASIQALSNSSIINLNPTQSTQFLTLWVDTDCFYKCLPRTFSHVDCILNGLIFISFTGPTIQTIVVVIESHMARKEISNVCCFKRCFVYIQFCHTVLSKLVRVLGFEPRCSRRGILSPLGLTNFPIPANT